MDKWGLTSGVSGCNVIVTWNRQEEADGYYVWGSNQYSVFHILDKVEEEESYYVWNALDRKDVFYVKISAYVQANGNEVIISESDLIEVNSLHEEKMSITAVKSYNGTTLSWTDMDFSDGYYVYRRRDGQWTCLSELSDHQITFSSIEESTCFAVVAYRVREKKKECYKYSEVFTFMGHEIPKNISCEVSIVVPCYNNEVYTPRCIDSVLASTYKNYELILVDDGSTDGTGDILEWYKLNYPDQIVVLHKINGGVADARNEGIRIARGEAICFFDSDDIVHPKMLELMYQNMMTLGVDVVVSQYFRYEKDCRLLRYCLPVKPNTKIKAEELLDRMYTNGFNTATVWNKMYRMDIVKEHPYPKIKIEDGAWTPYILSFMKTASYIDCPLYGWDRRVEIQKKTASNYIVEMKRTERVIEDKEVNLFFIENGAKEKQNNLLSIAVRRTVQRLKRYKGENNPYRGFLYELNEKYGPLLENPCIIADANLYEEIRTILGKM